MADASWVNRGRASVPRRSRTPGQSKTTVSTVPPAAARAAEATRARPVRRVAGMIDSTAYENIVLVENSVLALAGESQEQCSCCVRCSRDDDPRPPPRRDDRPDQAGGLGAAGRRRGGRPVPASG